MDQRNATRLMNLSNRSPTPGRVSGCAHDSSRSGPTGLNKFNRARNAYETANGNFVGSIGFVDERRSEPRGSWRGVRNRVYPTSQSCRATASVSPTGADGPERPLAVFAHAQELTSPPRSDLWARFPGFAAVSPSGAGWLRPRIFDGESGCAVPKPLSRIRPCLDFNCFLFQLCPVVGRFARHNLQHVSWGRFAK